MSQHKITSRLLLFYSYVVMCPLSSRMWRCLNGGHHPRAESLIVKNVFLPPNIIPNIIPQHVFYSSITFAFKACYDIKSKLWVKVVYVPCLWFTSLFLTWYLHLSGICLNMSKVKVQIQFIMFNKHCSTPTCFWGHIWSQIMENVRLLGLMFFK